jgi:hypothetical protein
MVASRSTLATYQAMGADVERLQSIESMGLEAGIVALWVLASGHAIGLLVHVRPAFATAES